MTAEERQQIRERAWNSQYERNQGPYAGYYHRDVYALLDELLKAERSVERLEKERPTDEEQDWLRRWRLGESGWGKVCELNSTVERLEKERDEAVRLLSWASGWVRPSYKSDFDKLNEANRFLVRVAPSSPGRP